MKNANLLRSTPDSAILESREYQELLHRVVTLETFVREFLVKQREIAIIQMGDIENRLGMPRTKEKRK